ncbi:MAG: prolipoprotein diacylglyceryl transferase family protein [Chloroflexota bacterium]
MLPILRIGPLSIQLPGLILLLGAWLGLTLAELHARRHQISARDIYNLSLIALLSAIVGARLYYVLRYPNVFSQSLLSLFSLNPGLLDPIEGATTAAIAAIIYGQRRNLPFWSTLDALTPALACTMIAISLSNLSSGAAFGAPTSLPWGIELWGAHRHPTQIYETLAASLILFILWPGQSWLRASFQGEYFLQLIAMSAAARLLLEAFRGDSLLWMGGFRAAQIIAWLILAGCLLAIRYKQRLSAPPKPVG